MRNDYAEYWKRHEVDSRLKASTNDLFNRWEWEWFITLNLVRNGCPEAEDLLKKWRIELTTSEHIQIAYEGIYNNIPQAHIHLLAFGKNKDGKSLLDVNHRRWEKRWSVLTKKPAVIIPVYSQKGVTQYVSHFNTPPGHSELLQPYNKKLLDKGLIQ